MTGNARKFFVIFTMVVYMLFGALAAVAAAAGLVCLFLAPPLGLGLIIAAAVLGVMSWQVKRTFDGIITDASSNRP